MSFTPGVFMGAMNTAPKALVLIGVVATGSALTHANFIAHPATTPIKSKAFGAVFIAPMNTPGVKLICRPSYAMAAEVMGSPFDYPLSSRMDENDAILI